MFPLIWYFDCSDLPAIDVVFGDGLTIGQGNGVLTRSPAVRREREAAMPEVLELLFPSRVPGEYAVALGSIYTITNAIREQRTLHFEDLRDTELYRNSDIVRCTGVAKHGMRTNPEICLSPRIRSDRLEIEIQDNGKGIPEAMHEKFFTPFFTTKPAAVGTGLGLSLNFDIVVKQHGGDLTVESEPGQSTDFTASLPKTLPIIAAASSGDSSVNDETRA